MEPRWLWPFELIEKLGEGGMGLVYKARYSGNDRMVAVKLLPAEVAADPVLSARFERELDVLKQLHHPNIVRCFGGTCETAERFYAMELVDGGTLAELLARKGKLPWQFVVDYALQMCEALQYAHEHGVIHRDVKPGNFLLTKSGQIKLSDFGLAAIATTNRLTAAGRTVGTLHYMAPEQIRGKASLTGRVDLYALGCVMFEMLSGEPPYSGDNAATVMQQHLNGAIPHVANEVLDCPLKLDELIYQLLSKNADDRPSTAAEVGWRLEEILQPGRRVTPVEPDLFSGTFSRTKVDVVQSVIEMPSDANIAVPARWTANSILAWGVATVLLLACGSLWVQSSRATSRLHHAEQQWMELFERSDPHIRVLAAKSLEEFGPLQPKSIQKLRDATRDADPSIRVAALSALGRHAAECQWMQGEMLKIEKVDEHPDVRHQASIALEAMKNAPSGGSFGSYIVGAIALIAIAGFGLLGWNVWQRLKPLATA